MKRTLESPQQPNQKYPRNLAQKNNNSARLKRKLNDIEASYQSPQKRLREEFVCGIIKKIRLENFMCHPSFSMEPNQNVNFITGANGAVFGKEFKIVEELLKKHEDQFDSKPLGPVGSHVHLKFPAIPGTNVANLVESVLSPLLTNYLCHSDRDRRTLIQFFDKVFVNCTKPRITTSTFLNKPHKVDKAKVPLVMMDLLEIDNANIFNFLVDQAQIESVAVCSDQEEAKRMRTHLQNLSYALSYHLSFYKFMPPTQNSSYRSYYLDKNVQGLLSGSTNEKIRQKKKEPQENMNEHNQQLPKGWKAILAHGPKDNRTSLCYISPTGKRFYSLESVKSYIIEIKDSDKRKIVPFGTVQSSSRKKLMNNNKTTEDCVFKLSPEIKRRRKQKSMKNPFKDLLKRTLKKNHENLKQQMEQQNPEHIILKVEFPEGEFTNFKVKRVTKMEKLMKAFYAQKVLRPGSVRLMLDDRRIHPNDTAETLSAEDGDVINVYSERPLNGVVETEERNQNLLLRGWSD